MPLRRMTGPTTSTFVPPPTNRVCSTQSMTNLRPLGPTVLDAREVERQLGQVTLPTGGLSHGRLQWVCRVRRSSAFSNGPVSLVTATTLGPPRLHDSTGSSGVVSPDAAPPPQMDPLTPAAPPSSQYTAPGHDACAAAEQLSNILLSYSHRDWDHAQRADPLCDATRRYIQLGRPNPSPRSLCNHLPSHTRPDIADITDLAAKGRLLEGDDDTILFGRKPITVASAPGHNSHKSRPPFDDPVRIYVPLLARP